MPPKKKGRKQKQYEVILMEKKLNKSWIVSFPQSKTLLDLRNDVTEQLLKQQIQNFRFSYEGGPVFKYRQHNSLACQFISYANPDADSQQEHDWYSDDECDDDQEYESSQRYYRNYDEGSQDEDGYSEDEEQEQQEKLQPIIFIKSEPKKNTKKSTLENAPNKSALKRQISNQKESKKEQLTNKKIQKLSEQSFTQSKATLQTYSNISLKTQPCQIISNLQLPQQNYQSLSKLQPTQTMQTVQSNQQIIVNLQSVQPVQQNYQNIPKPQPVQTFQPTVQAVQTVQQNYQSIPKPQPVQTYQSVQPAQTIQQNYQSTPNPNSQFAQAPRSVQAVQPAQTVQLNYQNIPKAQSVQQTQPAQSLQSLQNVKQNNQTISKPQLFQSFSPSLNSQPAETYSTQNYSNISKAQTFRTVPTQNYQKKQNTISKNTYTKQKKEDFYPQPEVEYPTKLLEMKQSQCRFVKRNQLYAFNHSNVEIDMAVFSQINWIHVKQLILNDCLIDDVGWWNFVGDASLFPNLKRLSIERNQITKVTMEDLEAFRLDYINFGKAGEKANPLTDKSKQQLELYKKKYPRCEVIYPPDSIHPLGWVFLIIFLFWLVQ